MNACVACENIALCDYQESVTTGHTDGRTDGQTDIGQSDPYVSLCFTGDIIKDLMSTYEIHVHVKLNTHIITYSLVNKNRNYVTLLPG